MGHRLPLFKRSHRYVFISKFLVYFADMNTIPSKRIPILIGALSLFAFSFLVYLIYFQQPSDSAPFFVEYLPAFNAINNTLSALCLTAGIICIKKKKVEAHKLSMMMAFLFSTLFLVSYIIYHHFVGDTLFLGTGFIRIVYFSILISHIVLSAAVLPLVLSTFYYGLSAQIDTHKKIAKYTYPLWMYISVTGVLIYLFLQIDY
jgi:putative membrane protein